MKPLAALAALTLMLVLVFGALAQAQTFTVLYNFTGGSDGSVPIAGVIQDSAGSLYGATELGGDLSCPLYGCGVVYSLDTAGREAVLHSFSGSDGAVPEAPVARDKAGNVYGTTAGGGAVWCQGGSRCGTVFKIDTTGTETVLYNFTGASDGCDPGQGLVRDKAGNLYGTTDGSTCSAFGTIFKLDSTGNFTLLHSFTGGSSDGAYPDGGHLTMDEAGNLYGVTTGGGANGEGALYKLSEKGMFKLLHSFSWGTSDGCNPFGSVVQDQAGNLFGTASRCGSNNYGTIWKVSKKGKETILHNFAGGASDGCDPESGVTRDSKGDLYGVTVGCGVNNYGVLYELSASGRLALLHRFDYSEGAYPNGEVLRTAKGTLYGTTLGGGSGNGCYEYGSCGTVWEYVP